ncbi:hypothetical protein H9L17_04970 [Thermomonas brevis]|uniref:Uncharacterized protein n=1 Tax=Thermomonas brevis TaxID=215691 RepID=A0A7G9QVW8_9GAMM|nr:hypothetical protein [Thermomonas brevis]QNN47493.1 hypothetical protein H9L17_04970 [Thermomonas brevis]
MAKKKTAKIPSTATQAAALLVKSKKGFIVPTPAQKKRILVALAKAGKVVYGRAYDIIKIKGKPINLNDSYDVERNIKRIMIYEIKSTRRDLGPNFQKYFFALTTAELLVAQSLKEQFKFVFVNIKRRHILEQTLKQVFQRATGIYPSWSISF